MREKPGEEGNSLHNAQTRTETKKNEEEEGQSKIAATKERYSTR